MSSTIPFQNATGKLTLADDDIRGAQWLTLVEDLAKAIAQGCPNRFDHRNNEQKTALQLAEYLDYQEAREAIVAKKQGT